MESKQLVKSSDAEGNNAFNRTSMESKPNNVSSISMKYITLLIEPVWNRNPVRPPSQIRGTLYF